MKFIFDCDKLNGGETLENYEIKNEIEEEQFENGESIEKQADEIYDDETFDWIHNNFLNK